MVLYPDKCAWVHCYCYALKRCLDILSEVLVLNIVGGFFGILPEVAEPAGLQVHCSCYRDSVPRYITAMSDRTIPWYVTD